MVYNISNEKISKITPELGYKIKNWMISRPSVIDPPDKNNVLNIDKLGTLKNCF